MDLIIQHIAQLLTLSPSPYSLGEGRGEVKPRGEGKARVGSQMSSLGIIEDGLVDYCGIHCLKNQEEQR